MQSVETIVSVAVVPVTLRSVKPGNAHTGATPTPPEGVDINDHPTPFGDVGKFDAFEKSLKSSPVKVFVALHGFSSNVVVSQYSHPRVFEHVPGAELRARISVARPCCARAGKEHSARSVISVATER